MPRLFHSSKSARHPESNQELRVIWRIAIDLDRLSRLGEGASVVARRDNVLRQVAALEVNINRSRKWKRTKEKEEGGEMGPKKGKDGGGGKGDKGQFARSFNPASHEGTANKKSNWNSNKSMSQISRLHCNNLDSSYFLGTCSTMSS